MTLAELRALIAAWRKDGTPGPWFDRQRKNGRSWIGLAWVGWDDVDTVIADTTGGASSDDALIAAAPAMADRIEALETAMRAVTCPYIVRQSRTAGQCIDAGVCACSLRALLDPEVDAVLAKLEAAPK